MNAADLLARTAKEGVAIEVAVLERTLGEVVARHGVGILQLRRDMIQRDRGTTHLIYARDILVAVIDVHREPGTMPDGAPGLQIWVERFWRHPPEGVD